MANVENIPLSVRAYLAGLVDGEGCIGIHKTSNGEMLRVVIYMTKIEGIALAKKYYGGCFHIRKSKNIKWADIYCWEVRSKAAEKFIKSIQRYLQIKRTQADIALEYRELFHTNKNLGKKRNFDGTLKDWFKEKRWELFLKMKELNKRGGVIVE